MGGEVKRGLGDRAVEKIGQVTDWARVEKRACNPPTRYQTTIVDTYFRKAAVLPSLKNTSKGKTARKSIQNHLRMYRVVIILRSVISDPKTL